MKKCTKRVILNANEIPLLKEHTFNCKSELIEEKYLTTESNCEIEKIEDNRKRKYDSDILNKASVLELKTEYFMTKFECLTCFEKFENQTDLLHHYVNEHLNKESNENDQNKRERDYVIKCNENGDEMFVCVACEKMYVKKKNILRHLLSHMGKRPFVCKICGKY